MVQQFIILDCQWILLVDRARVQCNTVYGMKQWCASTGGEVFFLEIYCNLPKVCFPSELLKRTFRVGTELNWWPSRRSSGHSSVVPIINKIIYNCKCKMEMGLVSRLMIILSFQDGFLLRSDQIGRGRYKSTSKESRHSFWKGVLSLLRRKHWVISRCPWLSRLSARCLTSLTSAGN